MRDFRRLDVWERGHLLTLAVYRATAGFPATEIYGLTAQMRRSASAVPTNIAEGCGRDGDAELKRFMLIAMGSASEPEYQVQLATELGFLPVNDGTALASDVVEVKRMLSSFIVKLRPT